MTSETKSSPQNAAATAPTVLAELPLLPLQAVLFPQGHLQLTVKEERYLKLMALSQHTGQPFGVVCLRQGAAASPGGHAANGAPDWEEIGTLATLKSLGAPEADGSRKVLCVGGKRFRFSRTRQTSKGWWVAQPALLLNDDAVMPPQERFKDAMIALARTVAALDLRSPGQFPADRHFTELGWVANRWSELLPIPLSARQQLMALPDPAVRLQLIDTFLRQKKLI